MQGRCVIGKPFLPQLHDSLIYLDKTAARLDAARTLAEGFHHRDPGVADHGPQRRPATRGEWKRRLTGLFADDLGPATRLIEATSRELAASPVHTLPQLPRWHDDRMIVIGDAAHAPSPSSGQGASLSIEDAVQLAKNLRDLPSPGQASAAFDRARRPRVQQIIKQAARVNSSKAATGASRVFRDAMLPHILRLIANSKHSRQLYGDHIDWEAP
ncbi:MAG: FAD-dependent monooxygenase [Streptosporangiaceae bacterium]|jgi:2-polyprenyl-6-methoxyphenol hydroxylase-like FAD-dependent oxidoreductase